MQYVIVYPYIKYDFEEMSPKNQDVMVVEKLKPAHLKGLLNLIGGKIEEGETPEETALRELKEETDVTGYDPVYLGEITGSWGSVHCIKVRVVSLDCFPPDEEIEKPYWTKWRYIKDDPRLIPNLRLIIPLMMTDTAGWKIEDENNRGDVVTMGLTLQTHRS